MKRVISVLLVLMLLLPVVSCGGYKVKDEDKALKVYTCPKDNMLGLEKIVVFENEIAVVMDKETADKSPCGINADRVIETRKLDVNVLLSGGNGEFNTSDTIEVSNGKVIIRYTINWSEEGIKIDPDQGMNVESITINERNIMIEGENLSITYTEEIADGFCNYSQNYDASIKTWGRLKQSVNTIDNAV